MKNKKSVITAGLFGLCAVIWLINAFRWEDHSMALLAAATNLAAAIVWGVRAWRSEA